MMCARLRLGHLFLASIPLLVVAAGLQAAETDDAISYDQQIRPIFQAHCHGCHQPAKPSGEYVMTSFERLLKGGESETATVVPGEPDASSLIDLITPVDGTAEMPQGRPPLSADDVALIRTWIGQGAADDTPENARQRFDQEHPPSYSRAPVVTSLDYSPDGKLLAVAGFHEVLLRTAEDNQLVARLVGMAERIESVRFSPDGSLLAVAGGQPGRAGELQIWDVATGELQLSRAVTFDTLYGGSWSMDGKRIAFGCADNSVRVIDAATGDQVVYMAAHDDLVRGTVFSADGKSIFSASRDMTVKQTDVATQRFVGNVTTHTPGVLRGGMIAVDRHPQRPELLVGGADGAPKLFRMETKAAPAGGGNPNQIREYEAMPGRVFAVRFSPDGTRAFAGSSLNGTGQLRCYGTSSGKLLWQLKVPDSGIYALACTPGGDTLAAAGIDGRIRLVDTATGDLRSTVLPVELEPETGAAGDWFLQISDEPTPVVTDDAAESAVGNAALRGLSAEPAEIHLSKPTDYVQIVLTATRSGDTVDVTRAAAYRVQGDVGRITADGLFQPTKNGQGKVLVELAGVNLEIPVTVVSPAEPYLPDFVRDATPILSRLGCNQGTCHGAAKGKNGFKLSLRGYDASLDVRALTDDLAARRVNVASPDDSLMLLKATAAVPHQGGQLFRPADSYYQILRRWITNGAVLDLETPRVTGIEVQPNNPVVQQLGGTQQMRVVATYADGSERDVTREAHLDSGNTEVAMADQQGLMTAVRRGEAPVLARYEGAYAATTLTVMGDRSGFVWQQPETWGPIDEMVAAKWQRMKIQPSGLCTDAEFFRRVYLDLTGLPPTVDQVRKFLADPRQTRVKRDELVDRLVGSDEYLEFWTNKWADLLQVNRKFLGPVGAAAFRQWIRDQVGANVAYDEFARKILTATGSNRENPPASYFKILRDPLDTMENTTHLFLGVRFNCNKCHDHPFERWTQDQYYQTAAYMARFDLKPDPGAGGKKIGGTAVEGAKALYEIVSDNPQGDVVHIRTQQVAAPQFPFDCDYKAPANATRRQEFAAWITSPDNPYFARSFVNRLWGYMLGTGIIEPLDDIRAGNPPMNPALLDYLAQEFIDSGFDTQHVMRLICRSRTYQLSLETNRWNEDDGINYSHAIARRLPAEVLYDAIYRATGTVSRIPGVPDGTRAAALPDAGVRLPDGFLSNLGRPVRESSCECERSSGLQLGPVMALISGPTVDRALSDPDNALRQLADSAMDNTQLIEELFLRILNRPANPDEIQSALSALDALPGEHARLKREHQQREQELAPAIAEQERQRNEAIVAAKGELEKYEEKIADREAELDEKHAQRLAEATAALTAYEQQLPARQAAWEQQVQQPANWTALDPIDLLATNDARLEKQDDLSVLASGSNGKTTYKFVARTERTDVTGIKLELFADDRLPGKGPGRADNGNFVLSEFRVEWAAEDTPDKRSPVPLQNARADYSQKGYDVKTAIDGQAPAQGNGWATSPETGKDRTAIFETRDNTGSGPGQFTFWLDQQYQDGNHTIGRFRISITNSPRPITLEGLPENIVKILAIAQEQRSDEQRSELLKVYRSVDGELKKLEQAQAAAKQPRPVDPQLKQLRDRLAEASKPLPVDPELARLRRDVQLSTQQLKDARLTFAQDLAWALINNPAFLFNH